MTEERTTIVQFSDAFKAADFAKARSLLKQHPTLLKDGGYERLFLEKAVREDNVEKVALLVELGADINLPQLNGSPEGPIYNAAMNGSINAVRWFIDHGAKINQKVKGVTRCFPLTSAVHSGHFEVVKLLVEHGADINAVWADNNALSFAVMYGQKEIEEYLRTQGAKLPQELPGFKAPKSEDVFLEHIKEHLGKPKPLALQEVVPGDPPITIFAIPPKGKRKALALVTSGMSERALTVPTGGEQYQYAELVMYLPAKWPLTKKALEAAKNFWPIDWLRRIARYPHEHKTWLGGASAVIANGEPPEPLAPNTKLTCLLAVTEQSDFGQLVLPDGKSIVFYSLYPLYTEERDLEKEKGTRHLLELFQKHKISRTVEVDRPNVAKGS